MDQQITDWNFEQFGERYVEGEFFVFDEEEADDGCDGSREAERCDIIIEDVGGAGGWVAGIGYLVSSFMERYIFY